MKANTFDKSFARKRYFRGWLGQHLKGCLYNPLYGLKGTFKHDVTLEKGY